jgi:hypothetical protein
MTMEILIWVAKESNYHEDKVLWFLLSANRVHERRPRAGIGGTYVIAIRPAPTDFGREFAEDNPAVPAPSRDPRFTQRGAIPPISPIRPQVLGI